MSHFISPSFICVERFCLRQHCLSGGGCVHHGPGSCFPVAAGTRCTRCTHRFRISALRTHPRRFMAKRASLKASAAPFSRWPMSRPRSIRGFRRSGYTFYCTGRGRRVRLYVAAQYLPRISEWRFWSPRDRRESAADGFRPQCGQSLIGAVELFLGHLAHLRVAFVGKDGASLVSAVEQCPVAACGLGKAFESSLCIPL